MSELKLVAFDEEDLKVLSAYCQDAVLKTGNVSYEPGSRRLVIAMNRFVWEKKTGFFKRDYERRRSVLHFEGVSAMKTTGIDRARADDVLELLTLRFSAGDAPSGTIELIFAGNAVIRLDVEYIEARLADLGAAWETGTRPQHAV
ncbi:DUF2948 family protein [Aliihoeflea sp. PC F10.4]